MSAPLLSLRELEISLATAAGRATVVQGLGFDLWPGRTLGLVGESGSGKSLTIAAVLGILPRGARLERGTLLFEGHDITRGSGRELARLRGRRMGWIPQEPLAALDPLWSVRAQVAELLRRHRSLGRRAALEEAERALVAMGLPAGELYPHQLSGGMRQRALIVLATILSPSLLLADEPTSALDASIQAETLERIAAEQARHASALLFVSHDWQVVARMADEILVLYGGRALEHGPAAAVIERPAHPYTRALLDARVGGVARGGRLPTLEGSAPRLGEVLEGCVFRARCAHAEERCRTTSQALRPLAAHPEQRVACHRAEELERA